MLMKMSQYKSVMFTVSICIGSILLAILVAYACDSLKEAMDEAAEDYHDAQQTLIDYESQWLDAMLWGGGIGGGSTAAGTFLWTGSFQAVGKVTPIGTTIAAIGGLGYYAKKVADLQADVNEKSATYEAARGAYEACVNPPERYTYTDYGGHVYEFSTKEAYNDFLRLHGRPTI